jgi:hypothetical protein
MNIQDEINRIFKMQKENQGQLFIDAERKSYEDEERNLYCICGELKTACPDRYAHTIRGCVMFWLWKIIELAFILWVIAFYILVIN